VGNEGRPFRRPTHLDKKEAHALLERLHMDPFASKSIQELSGGQQQRVFIARALMQKADLYLMDEPFAGIDKTTEELIVAILKDLKASGKSVVIVHHDLATLESYFDHILLINKRLVAFGKTAEVLKGENIRMAFGSQPKVFERIVV
ncbi:MAG: ATP-binding cassette domain-containing protein, partial [Chlamydiota bacterium]